MNDSGLSTLDRIQLEIKQSIQREKELKKAHSQCSVKTEPEKKSNDIILIETQPSLQPTKQNGFRKFTQNTSTTKGVMHKFFKSRGKFAKSSINPMNSHSTWSSDATFKPAKIIIEKGSKPLRNGFVPAEEKMKRELHEFQQRETQLREERKKSQPNLMAALLLEEDNEFENLSNCMWSSGLKPSKSMANLYTNSDEGFEDNSSSTGGSLKPARSLAELCDLSDEEGSIPGTHSLILQFESLQFKNRPSSRSSRGSFSRDF
ncbi:uncharacterized protein mdu [Euwallacea fornicatus]|uniref:uncharacterized protein mdu n=1 Tax=Euwallacea fornicatus TaxID=995702 RepID=UPI00338D4FAF